MTNEEKLKVARDALLRLSREHDCGCSFPCRCNGEEWDRINTEGLRDIAIEALAIIDASSAEQPAGASVDGPEFRILFAAAEATIVEVGAPVAWDALIDFLNAWGAQQREAGSKAQVARYRVMLRNYAENRNQADARAEAAKEERDKANNAVEGYAQRTKAAEKERDELRAELADTGEWLSATQAVMPDGAWRVEPD